MPPERAKQLFQNLHEVAEQPPNVLPPARMPVQKYVKAAKLMRAAVVAAEKKVPKPVIHREPAQTDFFDKLLDESKKPADKRQIAA